MLCSADDRHARTLAAASLCTCVSPGPAARRAAYLLDPARPQTFVSVQVQVCLNQARSPGGTEAFGDLAIVSHM